MVAGDSKVDVSRPATELRNDGAVVISLGINLNDDNAQLKEMASAPGSRHVFAGHLIHLPTIMQVVNMRFFIGKC